IALAESYAKRRGKAPFDYFHINSVELGGDGNLLISARNTHAVYEIDRRTGAVLWRLGGRRSTFDMGPGTTFAWQHDARWPRPTTISLFDGHFIKGADSYRAYKFEWNGHPPGRPTVVAHKSGDGRVTVYASWNGATSVSRWQVHAGATPAEMKPLRTVERAGFETAVELRTDAKFFSVGAIGPSGTEATSGTVASG